MRNPTDDDRTMYLALKQDATRLAAVTRVKGEQIRSAFDLWLAGHGPGPNSEDIRAWEQLQALEAAACAKIDALIADIFI